MNDSQAPGGEGLPVVAWQHRKRKGSWGPAVIGDFIMEGFERRALTVRDDALTHAATLRAEVEKANEARRTAQGEAADMKARLANSGVVFRREHAKELGELRAEVERLTSELAEARRERDIEAAARAGLAARLDRAVKAAEEVFGIDAIRYKLSLFKNGRAMNHFPEHMDGGWFAFQRAENDAHVGLCDEIVRLRAALEAKP